jgi:hypothetical protein
MRRPRTASFTILVALATACATNEDDTMAASAGESENSADDESGAPAESSDSGDEDSSEVGGDDSSTGVDVDALWECEDEMVADVRVLVGPGYDAAMGGLLEPLQGTYTVSTTKAWVTMEQQAAFLEMSDLVTAELEATPGMVAYGLGIEPSCGFFRTLSIYRSQEDMFGFVFSDAHSEAISRAGELTTTGKTTSWELSADEFPPTWAMADEKLTNVPAF